MTEPDYAAIRARLAAARERLCCYVGPGCDCKYMTMNGEPFHSSEATGCCELSDALRVLDACAAKDAVIERLEREVEEHIAVIVDAQAEIARHHADHEPPA